MWKALFAGSVFACLLMPAEQEKAPVAAFPVVQITGRITKVEPFRSGEMMPSIIVESGGVSTKVMLCAMRYLLEQNFNLKAGAEVQVKGYKSPEAVVAIEVKLPEDGKTIKLRDENGWPVWRGGGAGGGRRHRGGNSE